MKSSLVAILFVTAVSASCVEEDSLPLCEESVSRGDVCEATPASYLVWCEVDGVYAFETATVVQCDAEGTPMCRSDYPNWWSYMFADCIFGCRDNTMFVIDADDLDDFDADALCRSMP